MPWAIITFMKHSYDVIMDKRGKKIQISPEIFPKKIFRNITSAIS